MLIAALFAALTGPADPPCDFATAVPVSVREVARTPEPWFGRCVRAEGYVRGNQFFADVAGFYRFRAADARDRPNDGWLGLYLPGRQGLDGNLRRGSVAGVLDGCGRIFERARAEAGRGVLIMLTGYCHYHAGLMLAPARFRSNGAASFARQTGEPARRLFGDLLESAAPPPEVAALVERFLAALRSGDAAALGDFVGPWSEHEPEGRAAQAVWRRFLTGERGSPLAPIRYAAAPRPVFFQERLLRAELAEGDAGHWFACFCKRGDCAGRWPISTFDATAEPSRPYVCLRAFNAAMSDEPPDRLGVDRRGPGLTEPR